MARGLRKRAAADLRVSSDIGAQLLIAAAAPLSNETSQKSHTAAAHKKPSKPTKLRSTLAGLLVLLGLLVACAAAPGLLPHAYLVFAFIALPWRSVSFCRRKYAFFLIDFCYFANLAVMAFLLCEPAKTTSAWKGLQAAVYVLSEGPLAAALLAWRCSWVLSSPDHSISVLIHLLPGLAMTAHRHYWQQIPLISSPTSWPAALAWLSNRSITEQLFTAVSMLSNNSPMASVLFKLNSLHHEMFNISSLADKSWFGSSPAGMAVFSASWWAWLVAAPLSFYLAWQFMYFFIVQVLLRSFIRANGFDTSYNALARRAKKAGGGLVSNFVRKGSIARRVTAYGFVQLMFTVVTMIIGIVTYHYWQAAALWQVCKFVLPLTWGVIDTYKQQRRWE